MAAMPMPGIYQQKCFDKYTTALELEQLIVGPPDSHCNGMYYKRSIPLFILGLQGEG